MKQQEIIQKLIAEANSAKYETEIADLLGESWLLINALSNEITELKTKIKPIIHQKSDALRLKLVASSINAQDYADASLLSQVVLDIAKKIESGFYRKIKD